MLVLLFNALYAATIVSHAAQLKSFSINEKVRRVDRKSVFEHIFTQVETDAFLLSPAKTKYLAQNITTNALATKDAFQINVTCEQGVAKTQCDKVKNALQNAGTRIASVLLIQNPIIVSCDFKPFCQGVSNCGLANVLGGAQYASAFEVKNKNGGSFMYPQGLVKNLQVDKEIQYGKNDIIAQFNSEHNFYFHDDGMPISDFQVDFEYVAVHELMHGLGFGSGFLQYSTIFEGATPGYLAPIIANADDPNTDDSTPLARIQPLDIFDSFIQGASGQMFKDLGSRINSLPIQNQNISSFLHTFETSGDPFKAAQQAYQDSISQLTFKATNGLDVALFAPAQFSQGSSISHVVIADATETDFLMIPALSPGITIDEIMKSFKANSVVGPKIKAVMESIGWPTVDNPQTAISIVGTKPTGAGFISFSRMVFVIAVFQFTFI